MDYLNLVYSYTVHQVCMGWSKDMCLLITSTRLNVLILCVLCFSFYACIKCQNTDLSILSD